MFYKKRYNILRFNFEKLFDEYTTVLQENHDLKLKLECVTNE